MFTAVLIFCALAGAPCVERELPLPAGADCTNGLASQATAAHMQAQDMSISADRWRFAGWRCKAAEEHT